MDNLSQSQAKEPAKTPENLTRIEARVLRDYIFSVADQVPRGHSRMKDALTFSGLDLSAFAVQEFRTDSFRMAAAFALSVPVFEDFQSDAFSAWVTNDKEHLKYM